MGRSIRQGTAGSRVSIPPGKSGAASLFRAVAVFCILSALTAAARGAEISRRAGAEPVSLPGVENLYRVSDTLYRSAQPSAEGMRELEKLGVRTVIDLRHDHDDAEELAGTRLRVIRIPTNSWFGIDEEEVVAFLRAAADPSNVPVLVHCRRGADRTGVMVAAYRIAVQGWSTEEAVEEMMEGPFGFRSLYFWLPRFVRKLDAKELRRQAGVEEFR